MGAAKNRADFWTVDEVKLLVDNFPHVSNIRMCELLGKPKMAVLSKAQRMNLKKTWRARQQILKDSKKI